MYMDVDDVCAILGVSKTYAYSLMREYNKELKAKGYIVVSGKISTEIPGRKDLWHESRGLAMGVYKKKEKTGKYRSITKTGREIGKENRKEDSGPRVKLRNGKEISCNSRARVWILNLEIFWRFITKIWMSVSEKTLCTRSDILLT